MRRAPGTGHGVTATCMTRSRPCAVRAGFPLAQTEMRTFFRRYFTHNRYVSATATPLEALQLNQGLGSGSVDLSSLYIDMRPYMNRSPFTVRRDCSASRVHQVRVVVAGGAATSNVFQKRAGAATCAGRHGRTQL